MFVAVTGVGVHFRSVRKRPVFRLDETDGFLRTVLYAGETVFAVAEYPDTFVRQFVIAARTHVRTHSAADAGVGYGKAFLAFHQKAHFGVETAALHKTPMLLPLLFRHRLMPMSSGGDIGGYLFKVFRNMLVHLDLLVHIEVGQRAAADNMMLSDMQDFFQQAPYAYLKVYALLYKNGSVENFPVPTAQPCILR